MPPKLSLVVGLNLSSVEGGLGLVGIPAFLGLWEATNLQLDFGSIVHQSVRSTTAARGFGRNDGRVNCDFPRYFVR